MSKAATLTESDFEKEVIDSKVPVLVDFWAPWCAPCRIMGPILDELASEMGSKVKIAKLDVDANPAVAARFNVVSIPYLAVFSGGKAVKEMIGVMPKEALKSVLEKFIK